MVEERPATCTMYIQISYTDLEKLHQSPYSEIIRDSQSRLNGSWETHVADFAGANNTTNFQKERGSGIEIVRTNCVIAACYYSNNSLWFQFSEGGIERLVLLVLHHVSTEGHTDGHGRAKHEGTNELYLNMVTFNFNMKMVSKTTVYLSSLSNLV